MSTQAVSLVKSRTFGSAATKAILFVLADYADSEWSSFASQRRIAAEAEVSERTVRRTLADLEASGIIRRERRHRKDGTRTSDRLLLVPDVIQSLPASLSASDDEGLPATVSATTGQPRPSLPATVSEPTGQALAAHEPSVEPSEEPSVGTIAPSRKRDPIWDELVTLFGDPAPSTTGLYGTVAKFLKERNATPEMMRERAQVLAVEWAERGETKRFGPGALMKWWPSFDGLVGQAAGTNVRDFKRERQDREALERAAEMDRKALEA